MSLLTGAQLEFYREQGHLTVAGVFDHPALPYNHALKLRVN